MKSKTTYDYNILSRDTASINTRVQNPTLQDTTVARLYKVVQFIQIENSTMSYNPVDNV